MADRNLSIVISAVNKTEKALSEVNKNIDALNKKTESTQKAFTAIAKVSAIAFAAVTAAVGIAAKQFSDAGDELEKMSIRTGISVEALSRLKYAADLSGASIDDIEVATKMMSRSLVDAESGIGSASDSLKKLNLNAFELLHMKPEDAFNKLSMAVADVKNPMERATLATELFGKQGTSLLPLLAEGSDGIKKMGQEADDLGITFTDKTAKSAADLQDSFSRLTGSTKGVTYAFGSAMQPALTAVNDRLVKAITVVTNFVKEHETLTRVVTETTVVVLGLATGVATMSKIWLQAQPILAALNTQFGLMNLTMRAIPWVAFTTVAVGAAMAIHDSLGKETKEITNEMETFGEYAGKTADKLRELRTPVEADSVLLKQLADDAKKASQEIADIQDSINKAIQDSADTQARIRADVGEEIVKQEQKIADLRKQIRDSDDYSERQKLMDQLATEQSALSSQSGLYTQYSSDITEARRRASLTDFQRRLEDLAKEKVQEEQRLTEVLIRLGKEKAAKIAALDEIKAKEKEHLDAVKKMNDDAQKEKIQLISDYEARYAQHIQTLNNLDAQRRAVNSTIFGGAVNGALNLFGNPDVKVNDALITKKGEVVQFHPDDNIVAMKDLGALNGGGGGVTVIVNGDVSGQELVDKVMDALAMNIKYQTRLA